MPFQKAINELYGYLDDQRKLLARSGQIPVAKVRPSDVVDAVPNFVGEVGKAIGKNSYAPEQLRSNYAEFYGFSPTEVRVNQPRQLRQNVIPDLANQVAVNYPIEVTNRYILKNNPFQFDESGVLNGSPLQRVLGQPDVVEAQADPVEQIANLNNRSQQILANAPEPVAPAEQTVSFGAEQPQKKGFKETYLEAHANDDVATKAKLHFAAARQYAAKQGIDFDQLDDNGQDEVMMTVYKELQRLIPETQEGSSSILEEAYNNPTPVKQTPEERHAQDVASAAALREQLLNEPFTIGTAERSTSNSNGNRNPTLNATQKNISKSLKLKNNKPYSVPESRSIVHIPNQPQTNTTAETTAVAQPQPTSTTQAVASTAVDSTGMPLWQKASLGALGIGGGYLAYKAMLDNQERERQELAMQQQQLGMGGYGQRPSYF